MTNSKAQASPLQHFLAGWLGGSVACVLLSPLEVIKTRLQSTSGRIAGMRADKLALHIFKTEGITGFYRGLVPHLMGVGPSRAFYFGAYNIMKKQLSHHSIGLAGPSLHLTAASVASIVSCTIMSPVWVVKTRLQLQQEPMKPLFASLFGKWRQPAAASVAAPIAAASVAGGAGATAAASAAAAAATGANVPYKGIADAFVRVYREEGLGAFYRGLTASYLGTGETALQFTFYGAMKDFVIHRESARVAQERRAAGLPPLDAAEMRRAAYSDSAAFVVSAGSKLLASLVTYPHEVLRTRMREQRSSTPRYHGVFQSMALIWREEGLRGLYGGMGVHMLRTVPNAAILVMVVEKVVGGEV